MFRIKRFGVYRRQMLFLLLLLLASPADDCYAQAPPPPVDEQSLESVLPTVVQRLAIRFSLGVVHGLFEETPLVKVREAVGTGNIRHRGHAGDSMFWLCYRRPQHRLWIVSHGEMGGPEHRVTEIIEELIEDALETSTDCPIIPRRFGPLVFDDTVRLGMSHSEVVAALGSPSKSEANRLVYSHHGSLANGFDETALLTLHFREETLVSMRGGKTTTN